MIDQGHLRNGEIETQRETTSKSASEDTHRGAGGRALVVTRQNRGVHLRKRCEDLKLLRCLIRPSLRHEKQRSFLFSRLDLLNRTDPGETVRNVEYILYVICIPPYGTPCRRKKNWTIFWEISEFREFSQIWGSAPSRLETLQLRE